MNTRKVGPGTITLTGDQQIDEVVANTILTVVDGHLDVRLMQDDVSLKTEQATSTVPLNIKVHNVAGIGSIESAGNVVINCPARLRVTINAINEIRANSIGDASELVSVAAGIHVKSVGDVCVLNAFGDIDAGNVGSACQLLSSNGNINARSLDNNCFANAPGSICVQRNTGIACALFSDNEHINVGCDIGSGSAMQAQTNIICRGNVDANSALATQTGDIKICGRVGDSTSLNAYNKLTVNCGVGVQAALVSVNDAIDLRGKIKSQTLVRALNEVEIFGKLEQGVEVTATNGGIRLNGTVGPESQLEGAGLIEVKGRVENQARLTCADGKIVIRGNVSDSAVLSADEVYINGVLQTQSLDQAMANVVQPEKNTPVQPHATLFKSPKMQQKGEVSVKVESLRRSTSP